MVNVDVASVTLSGTDDFDGTDLLQEHDAAGALAVAAETEVVVVTSDTVANFAAANALKGTNLLTAIGGAITVNAIGDEILLIVESDGGNLGIYCGSAGLDAGLANTEITLVAVLEDVDIADIVFTNFSNN